MLLKIKKKKKQALCFNEESLGLVRNTKVFA